MIQIVLQINFKSTCHLADAITLLVIAWITILPIFRDSLIFVFLGHNFLWWHSLTRKYVLYGTMNIMDLWHSNLQCSSPMEILPHYLIVDSIIVLGYAG